MQLPNLPRTEKTILEILKVHNKEVPMTNLLAFLFNPEGKHQLGSLFIDSLLETQCYNLDKTSPPERPLFKNGYSLHTEPFMVSPETNSDYDLPITLGSKVLIEKNASRKRIDLFIENKTEKFAIIIEFKINHALNNPLETYRKSVEKEIFKDYQLFFVVLTPDKKEAIYKSRGSFHFKQIILNDLVQTIKSKLSYHDLTEANNNNFYFQYFLQFINTIENRKKNQEIRELIIKYKLTSENIQGKSELDTQWKKELGKVGTELENKVRRLKRKIKLLKPGLHNGKGPENSIIPFNKYLGIKDQDISYKIRLTLKGWAIERWEMNIKTILHTYSYTTSTDFMSQKVKALIAENQQVASPQN